MHVRLLKNSQIITLLMLMIAPGFLTAEVLLDKATQFKLFGDVRYRYERDKRSDAVEAERTRSQIRARIGSSFQPVPAWAGHLRLSTDATTANNRDTTQSTTDNDKNGDFGLDQAYISYTPAPAFNLVLGKTDFIFFQQNDVFWDRDISPESVNFITRLGGLSLSATQMTLIEGEWQKDVTAEAAQLVYRSSGMTFAFGKARILRDEQFVRDGIKGFQSDEYTIWTAEEKRGSWGFGIEYITSNSASADTARILSFQQKLGTDYGYRIYRYMVEGFSVMGDGKFSQDDFPVEGSGGVSNFDGYKLQFDFFTSKNSSVDVSLYTMERIHDPAELGATASDAIMTRSKYKRAQVNFNVQF